MSANCVSPPAFRRVASGFCGQQQQIPAPLPAPHPRSAPRWKSTLGTGTFCYFCRKTRSAKTRHPPHLPYPIPPSVTPLHLCIPPFKGKNQAPGLLGAGLALEAPVVGSCEAARARAGTGPEPGGYLGAEGGEAGEPGGAGSHTSHRRSAGEVADLTAAIYARTCPRV